MGFGDVVSGYGVVGTFSGVVDDETAGGFVEGWGLAFCSLVGFPLIADCFCFETGFFLGGFVRFGYIGILRGLTMRFVTSGVGGDCGKVLATLDLVVRGGVFGLSMIQSC